MIRQIMFISPFVFTFPIWIKWACEWMIMGGEYLIKVFG